MIDPKHQAEPQQDDAHRWRTWAAPGLFVLIAWLILMTFADYGVSWDEYFRWNGGERKLEYYQSLFNGDWELAAKQRAQADHYPGFFDLSLAIARRLSPLNLVETGHLWTALFGFAGLIGVYLLGRELGGHWTGLTAATLLALTPRYWGHLFINPKDIPFAATFTLAMWALLRVLGRPEKMHWRSALWFGVAAGACMSTRVGGLLLFCYAGLFLGLQALWYGWRVGGSRAKLMSEVWRLTRWLLLAAAPAFLLLLAFWPNAHRNPFTTTAETLGEITSFGWAGLALYRGELLGAGDIPWHYLPTMLMLSLPDFWWFIIVSGLGVLVLTRGKALRPKRFTRLHALSGALCFGAVFPVVYILLKRAVVYDGIRHVLFILPLLAPLLALAATSVYRRLQGARAGLSMAWAGALALLCLLTVWDSVRLHPYQYTYFNRLSGGLAAADGQYDIEYWGTAYREAADIMMMAAQEDPQLTERSEAIRVAMIPPRQIVFQHYDQIAQPPMAMLAFFLSEGFVLVQPEENPDFYIGIRRFGFADMLPGKTVGEVKRDGVLLARVTRASNG